MVDFWVNFAISILKVLLTQLHVDLSKQSVFKTVLLDLANAIYVIYGIAPPTPAVTAVLTASASPVGPQSV